MQKSFGKSTASAPVAPAAAATEQRPTRPTHNLVYKVGGQDKFTKVTGLWSTDKGFLRSTVGAEAVTIPANAQFYIFENSEQKN